MAGIVLGVVFSLVAIGLIIMFIFLGYKFYMNRLDSKPISKYK